MTTNSLSYKLYTDHLEEIDFLLTQRVVLFSDPEVDWPEIEEFEKRLFAHVKGLAQGGGAADKVAAELLDSGDLDQIRAAVFALAQSKSSQAADNIWLAIEKTSEELAPAFVDGLKHVQNVAIDSRLSGYLTHNSATVRTVAVSTLGYRRTLDPGSAQKSLQDNAPNVIKAASSACCSGGLSACVPLLMDLLGHEDKKIACEAALALSMYQMPEGYRWLRDICQSGPLDPAIAAIYLALNGRAGDYGLFISRDDELSPDEVEAIGIFGDPAAVPYLLNILRSDNKLRHFDAATSLALITGAPLEEEYAESEDFGDEDEETADSAESTYIRVATSADAWSDWWKQNEQRFKTGSRYRNGEVYSTSAVIAEIKNPKSKIRRRRLAYMELLINQAISEPFEADWFIERQYDTLNRW